ncbi:Hypothetical predicted protein [Podarcis lilfordi]|uniref:Uncharacterized protein n=1 Tax=Podarcis lilfordi TaxID=74358 RepID=A0AA35K462_9SAUR|nr:Hypothetical predicted protein [Podarcis lilfordi]
MRKMVALESSAFSSVHLSTTLTCKTSYTGAAKVQEEDRALKAMPEQMILLQYTANILKQKTSFNFKKCL